MITQKEILDAYVFLRTNNQSIPDEVLDFIKEAALEKLKVEQIKKNKPIPPPSIARNEGLQFFTKKCIETAVALKRRLFCFLARVKM